MISCLHKLDILKKKKNYQIIRNTERTLLIAITIHLKILTKKKEKGKKGH